MIAIAKVSSDWSHLPRTDLCHQPPRTVSQTSMPWPCPRSFLLTCRELFTTLSFEIQLFTPWWVGLCAPPPNNVDVLTPVPVNVTLFGTRVFEDHQVKIRSLEWGLTQYACSLIKRGDLDTGTNKYRHREGAIYKPGNVRGHRKLEGGLQQILPHSELPEGTNPGDIFLCVFLIFIKV